MRPLTGVGRSAGPRIPGRSAAWPGAGRRRLFVALLVTLSWVRARATDSPVCDWLVAIGDSAQSLSSDEPERAEAAARRAAAARPRGAAGARASAALGLALLARGLPGPAAEVLEVALAPPTVPARTHLEFLRGEALLLAGDAPDAARVLSHAARPKRLLVSRKASFLEGRALLLAGLPAESVSVLVPLLSKYPDDPAASAARIDLAAARRAEGDEEGAVVLYREVWLSATPPEAEVAGDRLEAWRVAGGPVPPSTWQDHLLRADRLLVGGRPEDALSELERAGNDESAPPDRLQAYRSAALAALGRLHDAARLAEPLRQSPDPEVSRTAELVLARDAAREGQVDEAIDHYRRVSASTAAVPGLSPPRLRELGDEAAYLAAWLPYDAGDYARAAASLEAFGRSRPRSRRAEDALWFAAWSLVRAGKRAEAARALHGLSDGPLADAAAYWEGRLRYGAREASLLRRASALGGDGWYGFLARARLAAIGEPIPRPPRPPSRPLPEVLASGSAAELGVAVELFGLGLGDEAIEELHQVAASARARAAAPHLAQLAAFAGDAEVPFQMARDHLGPSRRVLRWSHPSPHAAILEPSAAAAHLDPALVFAVMRRESSFRRGVRSVAGAEGLLQLRPATAERMATLLGLPSGAGARLGDPAVNLPLGIHYLGLLAARFEDPAVAIAAYNAGPATAEEWARARAGMPLDEWVECVPFRETRQYLRAVLSDWDVYRELRGELSTPLDPTRPVPLPVKGVQF
ncbi:MAG TPA: transglycosylase SLT domain-containing protein [Anaeromyxobacter sp.]|nr:transglycosylase SLT domain-containing protein [Anaeromyxobacter sp.]